MDKCDNAESAYAAKLKLRRNVLAEVKPASVLDCFCGHGAMWRGAWEDADSYVGCDERPPEPGDPPRFWCDNLTLLRALDLQQFNVFDLDAYGSPWAQMVVLAARRRWASGERGAVVLTDGSAMNASRGGRCVGMAELLRIAPINSHHHTGRLGVDRYRVDARNALASWCRRSRVRVTRRWFADAKGSRQGASCVTYTALVFEGLPDQPKLS